MYEVSKPDPPKTVEVDPVIDPVHCVWCLDLDILVFTLDAKTQHYRLSTRNLFQDLFVAPFAVMGFRTRATAVAHLRRLLIDYALRKFEDSPYASQGYSFEVKITLYQDDP